MKVTLYESKFNLTALCLLVLIFCDFSFSEDNVKSLPVTLNAEFGFLSVLDHKVQFGRKGTYLDYNETGGQDILFPFSRFSISSQFNRHLFWLIYQPLLLETSDLLDRDLIIDSLIFPENTPVKFTYGFPFYRFSYAYDITPPDGEWEIGLGASLQIRNATITFQSADGTLYRTNRNTGLVPALKAYVSYKMAVNFIVETEIDGIYAPVSYLNGDDNDVKGALLDASIRAGYTPNDRYTLFLNLRYIGGGAEGQSDNYEPPSDGYVKNWLHFLTVGVRLEWKIF